MEYFFVCFLCPFILQFHFKSWKHSGHNIFTSHTVYYAFCVPYDSNNSNNNRWLVPYTTVTSWSVSWRVPVILYEGTDCLISGWMKSEGRKISHIFVSGSPMSERASFCFGVCRLRQLVRYSFPPCVHSAVSIVPPVLWISILLHLVSQRQGGRKIRETWRQSIALLT